MSWRPDEFIYITLSPQQVESGKFSLLRRRRPGITEEKIWKIGREARSVRYMEIDYALEMSGGLLPGGEGYAWFLCPVILDWHEIGRQTDIAGPAPFVETNRWRVNPNIDMGDVVRMAEPDINFVPTRIDANGAPPTFEQLQDFVHGLRLDPQAPRPQANVTATEEGVRLQHTGRRLGDLHGLNWQRDVRQVDVNQALDQWNAMAHAIDPVVVERAVEMARADRAERAQATHRWVQDTAGNWARIRITGG